MARETFLQANMEGAPIKTAKGQTKGFTAAKASRSRKHMRIPFCTES